MTEDDINSFLRFLDRRGLAICNFSKNLTAYWPIDTGHLAKRFIEEQAK